MKSNFDRSCVVVVLLRICAQADTVGQEQSYLRTPPSATPAHALPAHRRAKEMTARTQTRKRGSIGN